MMFLALSCRWEGPGIPSPYRRTPPRSRVETELYYSCMNVRKIQSEGMSSDRPSQYRERGLMCTDLPQMLTQEDLDRDGTG